MSCPACGCTNPAGAPAHAVAAALRVDDVDGAIDAGLLEITDCAQCTLSCAQALAAARDARRSALAARERYHMRAARIERRAAERLAARAVPTVPVSDNAPAAPALPPAVAAALARAKAKAAGRPGA